MLKRMIRFGIMSGFWAVENLIIFFLFVDKFG